MSINNKDISLHLAIIGLDTSTDLNNIEKLINTGANVNLKDFLGRTPLHVAAWTGNTEVIKVLIGNGAKLNGSDHEGKNALHYAIAGKNLEAVEILLDRGIRMVKGNRPIAFSPMHIAAAKGLDDVLATLISKKNININAEDFDHYTALDLAEEFNHPSTCELLKKHGAKVNEKKTHKHRTSIPCRLFYCIKSTQK